MDTKCHVKGTLFSLCPSVDHNSIRVYVSLLVFDSFPWAGCKVHKGKDGVCLIEHVFLNAGTQRLREQCPGQEVRSGESIKEVKRHGPRCREVKGVQRARGQTETSLDLLAGEVQD